MALATSFGMHGHKYMHAVSSAWSRVSGGEVKQDNYVFYLICSTVFDNSIFDHCVMVLSL